MTGGFSPGLVLGPVRGTSAGMVGVGGLGGPVTDALLEADVSGTVVVDEVGTGLLGFEPLALVQPAASATTVAYAAIVRITRTDEMMPQSCAESQIEHVCCG
jgi:hypothetical protein